MWFLELDMHVFILNISNQGNIYVTNISRESYVLTNVLYKMVVTLCRKQNKKVRLRRMRHLRFCSETLLAVRHYAADRRFPPPPTLIQSKWKVQHNKIQPILFIIFNSIDTPSFIMICCLVLFIEIFFLGFTHW